jgi:hypothetical protein
VRADAIQTRARESQRTRSRSARIQYCSTLLALVVADDDDSGRFTRRSLPRFHLNRKLDRNTTARAGIDGVINSGVDAIVAPHLTNSTGPAVAGYPNLSIPVGIRNSGRPAGMLMYSTALHEAQLIGFGYDLEQEINVRQQPKFLNSVIPLPNAGLCTGGSQGKAHLPRGKIF